MRLVPKRRKQKFSFLSGVGQTRSTGLWSCEGAGGRVMTYADAMNYRMNTMSGMGNRPNCYPLDPPPEPAPAYIPPTVYAAPITLTQIQSPVQTQASGQDTAIGSNQPTQVAPDDTASILGQFTAALERMQTATPAPQMITPTPSSSSTTVSVAPPSEAAGTSALDFIEKNKLWLAGGVALLLGVVLYTTRRKRK